MRFDKRTGNDHVMPVDSTVECLVNWDVVPDCPEDNSITKWFSAALIHLPRIESMIDSVQWNITHLK